MLEIKIENNDCAFLGILDDNKLFHSCIQNALSCKEIEIPPSVKSAYLSTCPVLCDIQNVHALGIDVTHPTLQYKGIIDCIASYRYNRDWLVMIGKYKLLYDYHYSTVHFSNYLGVTHM